MPEDLYSGGAIRLFGRVYSGLVLGTNKEPATPGSGLNLASQLDPKTQPQLARIYGFSYAGNYFKLADPESFRKLVFIIRNLNDGSTQRFEVEARGHEEEVVEVTELK